MRAQAAYFEGGMGYRVDKTKGIAKGDEPETMCKLATDTSLVLSEGRLVQHLGLMKCAIADMVTSGKNYNVRDLRSASRHAILFCYLGYYRLIGGSFQNRCCFDYGNAETNNLDDGAGTMEAVYFGSAKGGLNHVS